MFQNVIFAEVFYIHLGTNCTLHTKDTAAAVQGLGHKMKVFKPFLPVER